MTGPGAGKTGKVTKVIRRKNMLVVDGANIVRLLLFLVSTFRRLSRSF